MVVDLTGVHIDSVPSSLPQVRNIGGLGSWNMYDSCRKASVGPEIGRQLLALVSVCLQLEPGDCGC